MFIFSVFLLIFKNLLGLSVIEREVLTLPTMIANLSISPFSFVKLASCILKLYYEVHNNLGLLCLPGELILLSLQNVPGHSPCDFSPLHLVPRFKTLDFPYGFLIGAGWLNLILIM